MSDEDARISIARLEQNISHLSDTLKDQKDLLNIILQDAQKRTEVAKETQILTEHSRKRQEEQLDSVKYTIRSIQDRIDNLHEDLKSLKEISNEKYTQMQLELDSFNNKIDSNWIFILKVISLVLAGAIAGAGTVSSGIRGWLIGL